MTETSVLIGNDVARRATDRYLPLLALGFGGYALFGKSFAYLGIPPLFVGEMLLCAGLLALIASGCITAIFTTLPALIAALLLIWVLLRTAQGIGAYGVDALRDGAVALYGGFAFIVAALLVERPARLAQVIGYLRILARWIVPISIGAYIVSRFAGTALPRLPGQDFELLSLRSGELATHICAVTVLVLGGLCRVGLTWTVIVITGGIIVASQSRGGMLAVLVPIIFAMVLIGQIRRIAVITAALTVILGLTYAADLSIDTPRGERPISARALVNNVASIATSNDANNLDGTKQWRLHWWEAIRNYTFHGPYFWTGKGFGPNLAEVDGFVVGLERGGAVLRSPHSIHMTYLARSGVPGLTLWILTCVTWAAALLLASIQARRRGDKDWANFFVFLVSYLASIIINASFDVALEGPMQGIPFWVIYGIGLGSLMIYRGQYVLARPVHMRPTPRIARVITGLVLLLSGTYLLPRPAAADQTGATAAATCPNKSIRISKGSWIQAYVDKAAPGTIFCIEAGLHRMQQISPKDDQVFVGLPGSILSGAEIITNIRRERSVWVAVAPRLTIRPFGTCLKSQPSCNNPIRFFLNDLPLKPVTRMEDVQAGTVFHDVEAGKAYLADDPRGRTLEITRRPYAFWSNGARNVVIKGFIVEKYATPAQQGAIFGDEDPRASRWLIEGNEVRYNSGAGISTSDNTIVRGNKVHHNGQLGISPNGTGVIIENNEIYENNIYGFDAAWEAGGVKAGNVRDLTLRRNNVHDNYGSGLWCDVDCRNILIEDNLVERNADAGIFYEISSDAVIRNNTVGLNGTGLGGQQGSAWFWGAGIQIAASMGVQVYGNKVTVAHGSTGIMLIDQGRKRPRGTFYRTADNIVRDNEIVYEGVAGVSGGASDVAASSPNFGIIERGGNRFDGNTYVFRRPMSAPPFIWGQAPISYSQFRTLGQEKRGQAIPSE